MNFTPFSTTYSGTIPTGSTVTQFTSAAKFGSNVAAGGGQVVGLLASDEAGVTYLRPVDANGFTLNLAQGSSSADGSQEADMFKLITLPITVPGAKPGDLPQQQTLQIQVVNPGGGSGTEKYLLQPFQQGNTTVLTVAYANPDQESADQPIQLQLQTAEQASQAQQQQNNNNNSSSSGTNTTTTISQTQSGLHSNEIVLPDVKGMNEDAGEESAQQAYPVAVVTHIPSDLILRSEDQDKDGQQGNASAKDKQQDKDKDTQGRSILEVCLTGEGYTTSGATTASVATSTSATQVAWAPTQGSVGTTVVDYLSRLSGQNLPLSLHHYLKFSPETIKREAQIESSPLQDQDGNPQDEMDPQHAAMQEDPNKVPKKKKKYKKKAPKPRKPRPGQVHIAFALDGTTLFCCPECNMAYPEKELLEQHLGAHKIERRFICDICGAGLKRKEHLERHKLGHNPERPYICSVCCKGFKRKEHLNLHFVIHSGEKSEVCPECGKGFHRKDHLRKHARSHLAKRVKEETIIVATESDLAQAQAQAQQVQNAVAQQASVVLAQQQAAAAQLAAVQTQHAENAAQQVAHQQPIILTTQHHHQH